MTRLTAASLAFGLVISGASTAVAAPKAKPPRVRVVDVAYSSPSAWYAGPCLSCPDVSMRSWERYVSVEVIDDVSGTGHLDVIWEGEGHPELVVCGETEKPTEVPPGSELTMYPWAHPGDACPTGFTTSGVVRFTFSDRR